MLILSNSEMSLMGPFGSNRTLSELRTPIMVHLVPQYHLAVDPLELPKGPTDPTLGTTVLRHTF